MGLTKNIRDVEKDLKELSDILHAMAVILFNKGVRARGPEEESLAGFVMKAHKTVVKIIHEEREAEKFITGVEKMLLS